jgi:hypothetical protein
LHQEPSGCGVAVHVRRAEFFAAVVCRVAGCGISCGEDSFLFVILTGKTMTMATYELNSLFAVLQFM